MLLFWCGFVSFLLGVKREWRWGGGGGGERGMVMIPMVSTLIDSGILLFLWLKTIPSVPGTNPEIFIPFSPRAWHYPWTHTSNIPSNQFHTIPLLHEDGGIMDTIMLIS